MKALVGSGASVMTIVGKSWDFQVTEVLGVSLDENCRMIADSVAFCASKVSEVVYDAEHFFDGFRKNPDYALKTLQAAVAAGAHWLVLCDTNGGTSRGGRRGRRRRPSGPSPVPVGIHTHNDGELAVANTLAADPPGGHPGPGDDQRDRRAVRERRPLQRRRQPRAQVRGLRPAPARQPGPPDRGLPVRLRDGQHELPARPALRRLQRLRPQGRDARPRHPQERQQLRAHRPGPRRQRAPGPGQRALGQVQHRREARRARPGAGFRPC